MLFRSLKIAIEDVLAGRDVEVAETAVDGCRITFPAQREPSTKVTFNEHIVPLLQTHCQDCHRESNPEAPFALVSYHDVADQAEMIAAVGAQQPLPPWHGRDFHGEFPNHPFGGEFLEWVSGFWSMRNPGGSPDAMMVASGRAEAWIEPRSKAWDLAPHKIITEEAGGVFRNFDGGSSIYGGNCITSNPHLADFILEFVKR